MKSLDLDMTSFDNDKAKMVYTQFSNAKSETIGKGCMQVLTEIQKYQQTGAEGVRLAVIALIAKELCDHYQLNIGDLFTVVGNRMNKAREEKLPELLTVRRFIREGEL